MRERDVEQVKNNPYYKQLAYLQFKTLQKKAYRVEESNAADAIGVAERLAQENELDFIFFDLPGTLNTKGVVKTLGVGNNGFHRLQAQFGNGIVVGILEFGALPAVHHIPD